MPTIALAFQKELSTQFGRLDGPPPATATDHCYSVLMYQIYCSSYFAKWIRMEGEDVINFMEFMWKYISEMAVEDLVRLLSTLRWVAPVPLPTFLLSDLRTVLRSPLHLFISFSHFLLISLPHPQDLSNFASKVSSHLEIFLQALLYLPPSFSLTLLPSDPKHPSILAVRKFLKKTILLTNVGPYLSPNATSNQVNPMVAEQVLEVAQGLLKWVEKGGKETVEARFSMDRWNVCAGGCLEGCEVEGWEEGGRLKTCTRVSS